MGVPQPNLAVGGAGGNLFAGRTKQGGPHRAIVCKRGGQESAGERVPKVGPRFIGARQYDPTGRVKHGVHHRPVVKARADEPGIGLEREAKAKTMTGLALGVRVVELPGARE